MTTTRVLAGLVSNGNVLADGTITPAEIGVISISGVTYPGDDQAANPAGGQTITVNGAGFASTPTVYVGGVIAPSVSFISSSQITFTSPAKTAGTYDIYVVNPSGSTAIRVYGISYSGTPTWTTGAGELGPVDANFTIQLVATGDAPLTYALSSGSTLPSGVTLSSGGLITGSALTVEQTFNFSVDAIDAQLQETPRSFAVTVSLADPYFKYVTLLLAGDPPATVFNFDASTNNFNVAINGDARSDKFTPYQGNGYYSLAFDGNGDYLTTTTTADFDLTGDFTVEMWINPSAAGNNTILSVGTPRGAYNYVIGLDSTNTITWSLNTSSTWNVSNSYTTTDTISLGVWTHLAFVKNGANFSIYFNGVSKYSTNSYAQPSTATGTVYVGTYFANTNNDGSFFRGYISNFRVVKGTAVYTAAFTPPTTPLTAVANTKFLIAQSNRFLDNSANNAALALTGDTKVHNNQPFTLSGTLATYGSGYFNGASYLSSAGSGTSFDLTGDFCIEGWFFFSSLTDVGVWGVQPANGQAGIRLTTENNLSVVLISGSGTAHAGPFSSSVAPGANRWNHIAVTRNGSDIRLWLNGVSVGSATSSSWTGTNLPLTVGMSRNYASGAAYYMNGYVTDFRVVKGSPVYTTAFTPPTAQLTAITNTQLLTTQYNSSSNNNGFKDNSQNNFPITRNGNPTQGTFTPYGTIGNWSTSFSGSSQNLYTSSTTALNVGSGNFTIECFFNVNAFNGGNILRGGNQYCFALLLSGTSVVYYLSSNGTTWDVASNLTAGSGLSVGTWCHLALVRNGNTFTPYINGVAGTTTTSSAALAALNGLNIGAEQNGTASGTFNGYISNVRVVVGTAVYTTNFTPPTSPLTAVSGTQLLACQNNRFIDNSSNNFTLTTAGTPSIQRFSPFGPGTAYTSSAIGGSAYFGASGYLNTPSNPAFGFGTGDFTVEFWIYPVVTANGWSLYHGSATDTFILNTTTTGNVVIRQYGVADLFTSATSLTVNAWNHVAVARSGTTISMWLNGSRANGATGTNSTNWAATAAYIGRADSSTPIVNGWMSEVRVVKGTAVYSPSATSITVPTAPLAPTANTQLMLSFTNSGVIDNSMMNDLETVGNAAVTTSVKKYGTGSLAFDGSGDYLASRASSTQLYSYNGDFTIEFWLYRNANGLTVLVDSRPTGSGGASPYWVVYINASNVAIWNVGNTDRITGTTTIANSTWYHFAVSRSGGSTRLFVNGAQQGSTYTDSTALICAAGRPYIGIDANDGSWALNGYIDDVRITNGYARYTANFTPPTAALKLK